MQEAHLERAGEPTLRLAIWQPPSPKGAIVITPGFAESIERWTHVADDFCEAGFEVVVYDLRGQGKSQGRRGHIDRFEQFTSDLFAITDHARQRFGFAAQGAPIGAGHSLGSLVTTVAALTRPSAFRGLGLWSPFWGLAIKPAAWRVYLGNKLTNIWPTYSDAAGLPLELLTHDKARVAMIEADLLRVKRVTARWFTETQLAQARVAKEFASLPLPVFCLAAGDDHVADVAITRSIFATSKRADHELHIEAGGYHELHQELERDQYIQQFRDKFLDWCA